MIELTKLLPNYVKFKVYATQRVMEHMRIGSLHRFRHYPDKKNTTIHRVMSKIVIDTFLFSDPPPCGSYQMFTYLHPVKPERLVVFQFATHIIVALPGEYKEKHDAQLHCKADQNQAAVGSR